jgi:hypothetical protein
MGQFGMLRKALNASNNTFFRENPTAVQTATLDGIAFLPADRNPLKLLEECLQTATTWELRSAAADAIQKALRLMASGGTAT